MLIGLIKYQPSLWLFAAVKKILKPCTKKPRKNKVCQKQGYAPNVIRAPCGRTGIKEEPVNEKRIHLSAAHPPHKEILLNFLSADSGG